MKHNQIIRKYLYSALALPVFGLLLCTGCSSTQDTGANQQLRNQRVATYTAESQEQAQTTTDSDLDPGYEWFY